MKFALAYYLLLLYSTVILKPLIPIAEDSVEHCFAEAYHIATVHAKYGNNHLEKEVADTNDSNNNSNTKNTLKEDDASLIHIGILMAENICRKNISNKISYILTPTSSIQKITLSKIFPPPKISD